MPAAWSKSRPDASPASADIGTGNGAPWNHKIRSPAGGDNLFLCSIVALDADTGKYVWHYQLNPGETWDYNAAMDMALADLDVGGKRRPVLMTAPKNGFFYVLDRETGKLISAEKYAPANWASRIDLKSGRPVENPEARYPAGKPAIVYPASAGARSVEAMSFNPETGLAYIPQIDKPEVYVDPTMPLDRWSFQPGEGFNPGLGAPPPSLHPRPATSALIAWDPRTQKPAWRHDLPGLRSFGGTLTTRGGLVVAGNAAGTFVVYDARSGKMLWSFDAQTSITAQPITYLANGRQYVSVIAGARFFDGANLPRQWSYQTQQWRVLTFALDGKDRLPPTPAEAGPILDDPAFRVDPARAVRGNAIYAQRCFICHGANVEGAGAAPTLTRSAAALDPQAFRSVLIDGALQPNGMPRFEILSPADLEDLRHYIRAKAREALKTR